METRMEEYFRSKDIAKRNKILKELVLELPENAKEFFLQSFKKERYLDMKLTAVRGYAFYAEEAEVEILMSKLLELLKKRSLQTSYNYQEYESMRSVFLMPYLLKSYGYKCFRDFHMQLEKQYNDMPDVFKNIFTLDEFGNVLSVRNPKETQEALRKLWNKQRKG